MFAKLSVLALCASIASALNLSVPPSVPVGEFVPVVVTELENAPSTAAIVLVNVDLGLNTVIDGAVSLVAALGVDIGTVLASDAYQLLVVNVETGVTIATSDLFAVVDAAVDLNL